jgi:hypothetical protein
MRRWQIIRFFIGVPCLLLEDASACPCHVRASTDLRALGHNSELCRSEGVEGRWRRPSGLIKSMVIYTFIKNKWKARAFVRKLNNALHV